MESVQPAQVLIPIGVVLVLGIMLLIWGDRPELAAAIRAKIAGTGQRAGAAPADDLSSADDEDEAKDDVDDAPATTTTQAGQRVAMRNNAGNAPLPDNGLLPEQARAIVRFHVRVEAVLAITASGKIGQTEAIERIFHCSRSSKPESVYAQARDAVVARRQRAESFPPLEPAQRAVRETLDLPH